MDGGKGRKERRDKKKKEEGKQLGNKTKSGSVTRRRDYTMMVARRAEQRGGERR
jgi:hypothetical protein